MKAEGIIKLVKTGGTVALSESEFRDFVQELGAIDDSFHITATNSKEGLVILAAAGSSTAAVAGPLEFIKRKFIAALAVLQREAHQTAIDKGWHDEDHEIGTWLMLTVTELAEAMEGARHRNPPSEHIPEFNAMEEELADVIIRILDMAEMRKLRLGDAIIAKMDFNRTREHKHGGKEF